MSRLSHSEIHMVHRIGWLRAAVLGANDGLVSTASLVVGVAAAGSGKPEVMIAGLAGLVAGAMSMAAGEYVSVSSQTDAEQADLARETRELEETPEAELEELTRIYVERGLDRDLAEKVAVQLTERDALGSHARDWHRQVICVFGIESGGARSYAAFNSRVMSPQIQWASALV